MTTNNDEQTADTFPARKWNKKEKHLNSLPSIWAHLKRHFGRPLSSTDPVEIIQLLL